MHKSKNPTKSQIKRFQCISEIGCIACILEDEYRRGTPPDIHHLIDGGKRQGHDFTVGLCPWHHRGIPILSMTKTETQEIAGPSLAISPHQFHKKYGSDSELLSYQNELLAMADGYD